MRNWAFLLLSATILSATDNTLYDELNKDAIFTMEQYHTDYFSLNLPIPSFEEKVFPNLQEQYVPLNDDEGKDYLPRTINVNEELPQRYRKVIEDSVYLQLLLVSSVGFLTLLPQSITSWDTKKLQKKSLSERWYEHILTPPVWDKDHWSVNYIGHPVSGAFYYTVARNDGMSIAESAVFSTLMSTFFWEYGYEAVAEIPSIQDLIITPLLGSILGEGMHILELKLDKQGGQIFGSKTMGNVSYFFLDPIGNIADGMKNILHYYNVNLDVTMMIQTYPRVDLRSPSRYMDPLGDSLRERERSYGFTITFQ